VPEHVALARSIVLATALAVLTACASSGSSSPSAAPTSGSSASGSDTARSEAPVPAESNPPGDIPDNLAFVPYKNVKGGYRFVHPEGWAEVTHGTDVHFTDKLNGVAVNVVTATQRPTVGSARRDDVARLRQTVPAFELRSVTGVSLPAGPAVLIVYRRNTTPDPVTGRQYRDEVQEYDVWGHGRVVRLALFGVVGADNVDAYRTMSRSLTLS
jgi:hypothetical protein